MRVCTARRRRSGTGSERNKLPRIVATQRLHLVRGARNPAGTPPSGMRRTTREGRGRYFYLLVPLSGAGRPRPALSYPVAPPGAFSHRARTRCTRSRCRPIRFNSKRSAFFTVRPKSRYCNGKAIRCAACFLVEKIAEAGQRFGLAVVSGDVFRNYAPQIRKEKNAHS